VAPEARAYHIAGAQHYIADSASAGILDELVTQPPIIGWLRALMVAFERWVRDGVEPPRVPIRTYQTARLVTVGHASQSFPRIPGFRCRRQPAPAAPSISARGSSASALNVNARTAAVPTATRLGQAHAALA